MGMKTSCYKTFENHFQGKHLQNIVNKCCLNILCILVIKQLMMIEGLKNIFSITFISSAKL